MLETIRSLPSQPGIYQFFDLNDKLLYVGKAKSLKARVKSYFRFTPQLSPSENLGARIAKMASEAVTLRYMVVQTESDALILENSLIKQLRPKYNILMRDDKTYPYIVVDFSQKYPRFEITRKVIAAKSSKGLRYFGPFTSGSKELLEALYESFMLVQKASCVNGKKACLYYQIGRCLAPCEFDVDKNYYDSIVKEAVEAIEKKEKLLPRLRERMFQLSGQLRFEEAGSMKSRIERITNLCAVSGVDFATTEDFDLFAVAFAFKRACVVRWFVRSGRLCGSSHTIIGCEAHEQFDKNELYERALVEFYANEQPLLVKTVYVADDMSDTTAIEALLSEKFDKKLLIKTPKIGDKRSIADLAVQNAQQLLGQSESSQKTMPCARLAQLLELESVPQKIEVFDASHLFGKACVGGMIVYDAHENGFLKSEYRHYNLEAKDEYGQMREMLVHRAQSFDKSPPPDLWIIDGGEAQLNLAQSVIESVGVQLPCIAIAKEKLDAKAHRAKGAAHDILVTLQGRIKLQPSDVRLQFVQKLRDEAHRFAIDFHRKQKRKEDKHVGMLDIRGIGQAKLKRALDYFGSFEAIAAADATALRAVFTEADAVAVREYFN